MKEFIPEELDDLKEFYDSSEYVVVSSTGRQFAKEMIDGSASFLDFTTPYSTFNIKEWIEATLNMMIYDPEDVDSSYDAEVTELIELFPNIDNYKKYINEISRYFILEDLEIFKQHINNGDQFYIDAAVRLEWFEILPDTVTSVFLF